MKLVGDFVCRIQPTEKLPVFLSREVTFYYAIAPENEMLIGCKILLRHREKDWRAYLKTQAIWHVENRSNLDYRWTGLWKRPAVYRKKLNGFLPQTVQFLTMKIMWLIVFHWHCWSKRRKMIPHIWMFLLLFWKVVSPDQWGFWILNRRRSIKKQSAAEKNLFSMQTTPVSRFWLLELAQEKVHSEKCSCLQTVLICWQWRPGLSNCSNCNIHGHNGKKILKAQRITQLKIWQSENWNEQGVCWNWLTIQYNCLLSD